MNVIIPLAGKGTRVNRGLPKPLVDIGGKPMIQVAVESLGIDGQYYFVTRKYEDESLNERLNSVLFEICDPDPIILTIDYDTDGPAISASLPFTMVDPMSELIVTNCDQYMDWDSNQFLTYCRMTKADGVVVTYKSNTPKNSYIELDEDGWGVRLAEKEVISEHSTNGIHYWREARMFFKSVVDMIHAEDTVNGEFYIAPSYNYMIQDGLKVASYPIHQKNHWAIGTDEDIETFLQEMVI